MRHTIILAVALLLAPMPATPQASFGDSASNPLVIAYQGGATTLDPIMRNENTTYAWQRHIFDTLTFQGRDGKAEPRIVTRWKIVGQNRWRLWLRKGVTFHNGRAMSAQDVADSIMDAGNNPKSQVRNFLVTVTRAEPSGADTVDVIARVPDPLLPIHLTQIPLMPEVDVKRDGARNFDSKPIGSGPYRFVSWLAQDHLVLQANEKYWGGKPVFTYVKLTNIPNGATRLAGLLSGQIQVAEKVDPPDFDRVKRSGNAYITVADGLRVIYLAMDYFRKTGSPGVPGGKNPFIDPRVRRAVYQAIDVNALRDKIFLGAALPATQWIAPANESFDPKAKRLPYDPAASKKLLAEAGYPNGFTVRLDATTDRYLNDSLVAQAVAGMLGAVGITTQVKAVTKAIFFPNMDKGDFTMYLAGWGNTDSISSWEAVFHCKDPVGGYGVSNRERYCNVKADQTMARAGSIFDPHFRIAAEREAYQIAERQDWAYVPLYWEKVIAGVNKHVNWESRLDELIFAWQMTRK